ncbi:MAG TPA: AAA family ATPase, partial [Candidatus Dormibacteraeota bacterium]|nr:AAA family ATPase [Candidatus Dormibacteraeota bacterium]
QARAVPPAIIFLDEIDAVGGRREATGVHGNREIEQTLNQILVELDGFEAGSGVIVMAATNRPDMLDDALVRPGRFDRKITIELPSREGRAAILAVHARGKPLAYDVDLEALARRTSGFSGADLAAMLNEAALLAARRNLEIIPSGLINEAIDRSVLGVASKGLKMADDQLRSTAYHEAGHGLVGRALPGAPPVSRLSVIRRGHHLGATWQEHDENNVTHSRSALLDQMAALLAGRVAEEVVFGEARSGGASDIDRASKLARLMVTEFGMSERLGPVVYHANETRYSPEIAATIDAEVRLLIEEATARARQVLEDGREALDRVAMALLERETLDGSEFEELVSAVPRLQAVGASGSDPAPLLVMRPPLPLP